MAKLSYGTDSTLGPQPLISAAVDFSDRRPEIWPNISRRFYRIHELGHRCADVTEGSDFMGGIWARERYEWSEPGLVRATIQDSNVFQKGGVWEFRVAPKADGGTRIEVLNHRKAMGLKGHMLGALLQLTGHKVLTKSLEQTIAKIEGNDGLGSCEPGAGA